MRLLELANKAFACNNKAFAVAKLSSSFLYCSGMLIGSYIWGSLADVFGRKSTLLTAMLINGICGLVSAFSPNFYVFLLLRFTSGIG